MPTSLNSTDGSGSPDTLAKTNTVTKTDTVTKSSDSEKKAQKPVRESESARETIESIVFAFVLAFLFRTFEAEAFVIPTGSMAPTLFGRHKDIACEQCGYEFQFGASSEVRRDANVVMDHSRVQKAACPNCRYRNKKAFKAPAYKGDRILVNKFQYELTDPKRFDVVVFKFPEDAKTNYIKRLVGLPGETIRIHNGNVYKLDENEKEIILRKDNPEKQRLIQIPVYDDTHPATALREAGWPARWAGVSRSAAKSETTVANWSETTEAWQADSEKHAYTIPLEVAHDGKTHWLRYRHFHPTHSQWERLENNDPLDPRPWLIGDYCGYNATASRDFPVEENEFFWVGDLTVSGKLEVEEIGPDADVVIELTEGFHLFRCHIDPNSGQARLTRVNESLNSEEEIELATVQTNLKGKGSYSFRYANVDDRLCLWIDNKFIDFGPEASYVSSDINELFPQETDLSPVGIAMTAVAGTVSSLLIERDIYYRAGYHEELHFRMPLDDVKAWQTTYMNRREEWDYLELKVPEENYLVLGDNSPASYDSRGWPSTNSFHRSAFVGKAFYIYWPHGIPMGVEDGWAIPISYNKKETRKGIVKDRSYPLHYIPFYPNFGRMRRIH